MVDRMSLRRTAHLQLYSVTRHRRLVVAVRWLGSSRSSTPGAWCVADARRSPEVMVGCASLIICAFSFHFHSTASSRLPYVISLSESLGLLLASSSATFRTQCAVSSDSIRSCSVYHLDLSFVVVGGNGRCRRSLLFCLALLGHTSGELGLRLGWCDLVLSIGHALENLLNTA